MNQDYNNLNQQQTPSEQTYYGEDPFLNDPEERKEPEAQPAAVSAEAAKQDSGAKGLSIAAMILGIASLVCGFGTNVVLAILSLCFVAKAKKRSETGSLNGFTTAGLVCSVISLALTVLVLIAIVFFLAFFGAELFEFFAELIEFYPDEFFY